MMHAYNKAFIDLEVKEIRLLHLLFWCRGRFFFLWLALPSAPRNKIKTQK
jgi:hypothetical protein